MHQLIKGLSVVFVIVALFSYVYEALHVPVPAAALRQGKLVAVDNQPKPPITILAWNVEAGGSHPATIASQLAALPADIICLSELPASETTSGAIYDLLLSTGRHGGRNDRLAIAWNSEKFTPRTSSELKQWNGVDLAKPGQRAPLVVLLQDNLTHRLFWVMNNHLARGDEAFRSLQTRTINKWVCNQSIPVIAVGDYNFHYDFRSNSATDAFTAFVDHGLWQWLKPDALIDTHWSDGNGDGEDDQPDSISDFVFVSGVWRSWDITSTVVIPAGGEFPDSDMTSDHYPLLTTIAR